MLKMCVCGCWWVWCCCLNIICIVCVWILCFLCRLLDCGVGGCGVICVWVCLCVFLFFCVNVMLRCLVFLLKCWRGLVSDGGGFCLFVCCVL